MSEPDLRLPVASAREARRLLGDVLRTQRLGVLGAATVLVTSSATGLLIPPMLGRLVDVAQRGGPESDLTLPLIVLGLAAVGQGLLFGVTTLVVARVGERALATLRERVMDSALALPLARVERGGTGDLVARVSNDVDQVSTALRNGFPQTIWAGLTVLLTVVGLAVLDWRLAVAGLTALPFQLLAARLYTKVSPPLYAAERAAEGDRSQQLVETLDGARTIQALLLGPRHLDRVAARSLTARRAYLRATDAGAWFFTRIHAGELTGVAAILFTGTVLVGNGTVTLGEAAAAALYFIRLFDPIGALLLLADDVQSATASLARLAGVAGYSVPDRVTGAVPADGGLHIAGLRFGYADGDDVLRGIDLDVRAGEQVAIVGSSGAGKTTLASLVAGVHDPRAGVVEFGGVPVADLGSERLAEHVTLVTQEVHVFAGTLREDLRLAAPEATDAQLEDALERVGALGWARALPDGLATAVGAGGLTLDPIRAQQLALARLVLRDADLVILDEATAEAGSAGARVLERGMERALAGRTALIVAHRLTSAARADRVIVLEGGRIVEDGPPDQLAAGDGRYARLWRAWTSTR